MNWIDITILIVLAVTTIKGLFDGIIKQVSSLLAIILAFAFCGLLAAPFTGLLFRWFPDIPPVVANVLGYAIAFLIIFLTVRLLGKIIEKVSHALLLKPIDRILGGAMGALIGLFVISLLLNAVDWVDPIDLPVTTRCEAGIELVWANKIDCAHALSRLGCPRCGRGR